MKEYIAKFDTNMKKLLLFIGCFWAMSLSATTVTIDATNLKLNEEVAGFPLYILRMEASSNTAAIRIQLHVTAEDYTGTYAIDADNSALVLPAGASTDQATQAVSGTMTVTRPNGNLTVKGSIVCTNGTTYKLNLRYETPDATRRDTLMINTLTLEDRTLSEQEFQIYGFNEDSCLYLQLTVFSNMLEGTYTSSDIYKPYSGVRVISGSSSEYFDLLEANLTVQKNGTRVLVTGSILCQSETNPADIPLYILYLSCAHDRRDEPMEGDATEADYEAFFEDYTQDKSEQALNGDIFVYARNADGQCVALDVYIADGETEITAGVYPIVQGTDLSNPYMTVHASEGIIAGFTTPSYAGYLNAESELTSVWYIMAGTVVIDEAGRIEVNAINSAERTVHCVLRGLPQGIEESMVDDTWTDGRCYNILGQPVPDDYHGIVIQNGQKRIQ